MAHRCKSIAGQKVTLGPGDKLIPGCELIDGSAFINGDEIGSCSIDGKDTNEECEAAGGTWIDPDELKKLQDMYNKLSDEMSGVGDDEAFGFCSIPEYDNKADCEANGGTWTDLDVNTDLDNVDTSTLTNELALQLDELSKCFADPNLKEYLEDL